MYMAHNKPIRLLFVQQTNELCISYSRIYLCRVILSLLPVLFPAWDLQSLLWSIVLWSSIALFLRQLVSSTRRWRNLCWYWRAVAASWSTLLNLIPPAVMQCDWVMPVSRLMPAEQTMMPRWKSLCKPNYSGACYGLTSVQLSLPSQVSPVSKSY